ncbi:hypothetical protein DOY81_013706, partial [Sarcophaga bullata]
MKIAIVLLAIVGLVASASIADKKVKIADKDFLAKQKFLFEIVYRVEDPLMFEEWIKMGKTFNFDKNGYTVRIRLHMQKFYEAYKHDALLPKGEFFGALVKSHLKQAYGLFEFFYYAKNWEVFQQNVAWARMHCNEGMFVYALTLAVIHRDDFHGLILPSVYEIFPQYFFNSKFVYDTEKFDYDVWSKYIMYEKEYKDILYKDYATFYKNYDNHDYFHTKDFKMWQWWKLMGLGEHWYAEEHFMLRENMDKFTKDSKYMEIFEGTKCSSCLLTTPVILNSTTRNPPCSYFTEDVGLNSFWYYFNMDYAFLLSGKKFGLEKERRGEYFLYTVRQLLSRYYMERLSHGYGEIPEFSFFDEIEYGYNPQLVHYNGVGFSYRKNYYEIESYGKHDYYLQVVDFFKRMDEIITKGYYVTYDGKKIDMRNPESIEIVGNMLQSGADSLDRQFFKYWYMFIHMYMGDVKLHDMNVFPNTFLNYETMMRDPLFYMIYKRLPMFTSTSSTTSSPTLMKNCCSLVSPSRTLRLTFVDGQFVWDKTLLARQMRLNHKPFDFDFKIESDKEQKVVIRAYLAPKFDEFGR